MHLALWFIIETDEPLMTHSSCGEIQDEVLALPKSQNTTFITIRMETIHLISGALVLYFSEGICSMIKSRFTEPPFFSPKEPFDSDLQGSEQP